MDEMKIPRKRAGEILDKIRQMLADGQDPETIQRFLEIQYDIPRLTECRGEAHKNAFIDNCWGCAPRWGWVGPKVRIT